MKKVLFSLLLLVIANTCFAQIYIPGMVNPSKSMVEDMPWADTNDVKLYIRKRFGKLADTSFNNPNKLIKEEGNKHFTSFLVKGKKRTDDPNKFYPDTVGLFIHRLNSLPKKDKTLRYSNGFLVSRKWFYGLSQDASLLSRISQTDSNNISTTGSIGFTLVQLERNYRDKFGYYPSKFHAITSTRFVFNFFLLIGANKKALEFNADKAKSNYNEELSPIVNSIINPNLSSRFLKNVTLSAQYFPFMSRDFKSFTRNLGFSGYFSATGLELSYINTDSTSLVKSKSNEGTILSYGLYLTHRTIGFSKENGDKLTLTMLPYVGFTGRSLAGLMATSSFKDQRYQILGTNRTTFIGWELGVQVLIEKFRIGASLTRFYRGNSENEIFDGTQTNGKNFSVGGLNTTIFQVNLAATFTELFN